jgi:uncharacterized membrane protein
MPIAAVSSASITQAEPRLDRGTRLPSLDIFRGLIMVWMALDHTRDFFTNIRFEPESIDLTWLGLFFTRWITHFCAPMFFLLAAHSGICSSARIERVRKSGRWCGSKLARSVAPASHDIDDDDLLS